MTASAGSTLAHVTSGAVGEACHHARSTREGAWGRGISRVAWNERGTR